MDKNIHFTIEEKIFDIYNTGKVTHFNRKNEKSTSFSAKYFTLLKNISWKIFHFTFSNSKKIVGHLIEDLLRGEAHGVHVVGPGGELLPGGEHVLDRAAETVVNVHHGQARVRAEVALVPPAINAITHL